MDPAGLGFQYTLTGTSCVRRLWRAVGSNNSLCVRVIVAIGFGIRFRGSCNCFVVGIIQRGIIVIVDLGGIVFFGLLRVKHIIGADVAVMRDRMMFRVIVALVISSRFPRQSIYYDIFCYHTDYL